MNRPEQRGMHRHFVALAATALSLFALVTVAQAQSGAAAPAAGSEQGKVVGIAFVGRMVADLDKSVAFYKAIGFTQDPKVDPAWRKDEITDQMYGVKGAQTRMAKMAINSSGSGKVFNVYLREFKGIARKKLTGYVTWEPGAPHFGLVVPDAEKLWAQLKANGMLNARSWNGELVAPPGQTKKMLAYLTDPDGLDIEIIDQRPATPAANGNAARPALLPGVNHVGLVSIDSTKSRAFYETLMGGKLVNPDPPWLKGDFYDSAVGGHGNIIRLFNESFAEAAAPDSRMNFEIVEYQNRKKPVQSYHLYDIGVSYVGFEVNGLDAFVARAKAAGARTISSSGVVPMKSGTRVIFMRDPDVGGFVQFFEHPKR